MNEFVAVVLDLLMESSNLDLGLPAISLSLLFTREVALCHRKHLVSSNIVPRRISKNLLIANLYTINTII